MGLLQRSRIERHGEPLYGVIEQITEDRCVIVGLGEKDIDRPYWVPRTVAEFDEEHLTGNELVDLAAFRNAIVTARVFRPYVGLLLQLPRNLDVARKWRLHHPFECHGQPIPGKHLAMLGHSDEVDAALVGVEVPVDALLNAGSVSLE